MGEYNTQFRMTDDLRHKHREQAREQASTAIYTMNELHEPLRHRGILVPQSEGIFQIGPNR